MIPLARPHLNISCKSLCSFSQFVCRSVEIASRPTSSAYPNLLAGVPSQKRGVMYSIKRIGEIGEPCGRPHQIFVAGPVSPSRRIFTDRFVVKDCIQRTRWSGQPCSRSLRTSLPGRTASNAPFTSIVRKDAFELLSRASSTSCVRHVVRSIDNCSGRALNC